MQFALLSSKICPKCTIHSPGLPGIVSDVVIKQTYFIHTVGGSYSNYSTVY